MSGRSQDEKLDALERIAFQLKLIKVELQRANDLTEATRKGRQEDEKMVKGLMGGLMDLVQSKGPQSVELVEEEDEAHE